MELCSKKCEACSGKTPLLTPEQILELLVQVPDWTVTTDGKRIRRNWRLKSFAIALDFCCQIGYVAEDENHHPDLHLTNYRDVMVDLWTHAVDGLTENDFIVAAKIDQITFNSE